MSYIWIMILRCPICIFSGDVDLIYEECANDGECTDDETICEYCGKHKLQNMFCCDSSWTYDKMHKCYGAQFKDNGPAFQCTRSVVTREDEGNSIIVMNVNQNLSRTSLTIFQE